MLGSACKVSSLCGVVECAYDFSIMIATLVCHFVPYISWLKAAAKAYNHLKKIVFYTHKKSAVG